MNFKYDKYKALLVLILMILGFTAPGRHLFFPFVKFPMYGYSKIQKTMKTVDYTLFWIDSKCDSIWLEDAYDLGFPRSRFKNEFLKPIFEDNIEHKKEELLSVLKRFGIIENSRGVGILRESYKVKNGHLLLTDKKSVILL